MSFAARKDPYLFFNLGSDQVYQTSLKGLEYVGESIYRTIEDEKSKMTTLLMKIGRSNIDVFNVVFGRAGGTTYDIPYTTLNSSFVLEDFNSPGMQILEFNDAFLAGFKYLFLDYTGQVPTSSIIGQNDPSRYLGVYRCSFFF